MSDTQRVEVTPEMEALLVKAGSRDPRSSYAAQAEIAKAIEIPLREAVFDGDISGGIFEVLKLEPGAPAEYPLHFVTPGTEKDFVAYTIPHAGRIPERHVEGDYVIVPTYEIGASIDMLLKYAEYARWDVVGEAGNVMDAQFAVKMNQDFWHTIIASAVDRNILVFDEDAAAGQFTKRLVSLMKVIMQRNGGGNTASRNRRMLTDLYTSPEAIEDIRNWGVDQIDELTRREIFTAADGSLNKIFNVLLHDLTEFGEGQEYQEYYTTELSATMAASDTEIVVGLDRSKRNTFVSPTRKPGVEIFVDDNMHRQRRMGWYGWLEFGAACTDGRAVLAGSY